MEALGEHMVVIGAGLLVLVFTLLSRRLQSGFISAPMLFVTVGILLGPEVSAVLHVSLNAHWLQTLAEITLVLTLYSDAVRIDFSRLRKEHNLPVRLLTLSLPLSILLGAGIGLLLFDVLFFWEAALLAAVLAPTDASLGQAVVNDERVPARIRQTLNIESGLNDGFVLPAILMMLAIACGTAGIVPDDYEGSAWFYWGQFVVLQILVAPIIGVLMGFSGARLIDLSQQKGWSSAPFLGLAMISQALLTYGVAEAIGANGFIAAFVAGLLVGKTIPDLSNKLHEFVEAEGQLLTLATFTIFGALMLPVLLPALDWRIVVYALLSLTIIRMLPVALSLLGAGLQWPTFAFLGWSGPRGLASLLFALLVLDRSDLPHVDLLMSLVFTTVFFSVFLHGISASRLAAAYSHWAYHRCPKGAPAEREAVVSEPRVRLSRANSH